MIYRNKKFYGITAMILTVVFIFGCGGKGFSRPLSDLSITRYKSDIDMLLEKHDLCTKGYSIEPDSAIVYTIMALKAAEAEYGFGSREYVDIFSEYMIPDCSDNTTLLMEYIYPVVTTRFSPDSLYVGSAYYMLARAMSGKNQFSMADHLFAMAAERTQNLKDSLTVEIEKAVNRRRGNNDVLYFALHPLIEKAESLNTPCKESFLFKIYGLLASNYVRLDSPDYPDSPLVFFDKANEYFDYADLTDRILFLHGKYKLLLDKDHREAIKCLDQMLPVFDQDSTDQFLDWHVMAYIDRGDYCANENLDYVAAIKYYLAANELLSSPFHNGLKVKWLLLRRMQRISRLMGLLDEACRLGEILVNISTKQSIDEMTMGYVLDLCDSYIAREKYDDLKKLLSHFKGSILQFEDLAYHYAIIESQVAMHDGNFQLALATLKSIDSDRLEPSKRARLFKKLLDVSSYYLPEDAPEYADTVNRILISEIQNKLLHISPSSRRNWHEICNDAMNTYIEAANQGAPITPQMLKLSIFRKSLLFRTTDEINKVVSANPQTKSDWKLLTTLRDSVSYYTNLADSSSVQHLTAKADSIEWGLTYKISNNRALREKLTPSIDNIIKTLGRNDVAIDFITAETDDKYVYSAIVFGKGEAPIYVPVFNLDDSFDKNTLKSIWRELKPYLNRDGNIYLCPDGILNSIGIEFLKDEDGVPMSQKYNIHRVFHLADIQRHGGIGKKVVAAGVSDHNSPLGHAETIERGSMTDLPNVAYEMQLIKKHLNPKHLTLMFNDEATEDNFKRLNGTDLSSLHISTHGIYRDNSTLEASAENPDDDDYHIARRMLRANKVSLSGLILRQGNMSWKSDKIMEDNDDILTSDEIENMSFPNLQLTVLSACDSGLGDIDSEGVWGLQRAFRIAGSKSLICSLRKIDDYWAAQFMEAFYEYAGNGKTIYDSFHHAQRMLYESEPDHPEIWSSFILIE